MENQNSTINKIDRILSELQRVNSEISEIADDIDYNGNYKLHRLINLMSYQMSLITDLFTELKNMIDEIVEEI